MVYCVIAIILFLFLCIVGIVIYLPYIRTKKRGIRAIATIVDLKEVRVGRSGQLKRYRPVFEFYDGTQTVHCEYQLALERRFIPEGEVAVYYLTENPNKVYMDGDPTPKTTMSALIALAAVFILAAVYFGSRF